MKKLIYGALLLLAVPAFQSCIDDSESPSVTQQRQEKTEQIKALKELYQAQAYAEKTIADAEAAYKKALADESKAQADLLAVELKKAQAELEYLQWFYKQKAVEAMNAYYAAGGDDAEYIALVNHYSNVCDQLATAQSELLEAQMDLIYQQAGIYDEEIQAEKNLAKNQALLLDQQQLLARLQQYQEYYNDVVGMTPEELEDAINELRQAMQLAGNDYYEAQVAYNASGLANKLNAALNKVTGSGYSVGLNLFAGNNLPYTFPQGSSLANNTISNAPTGVYLAKDMVENMSNSANQGLNITVWEEGKNGWETKIVTLSNIPSTLFSSANINSYGYLTRTLQFNGGNNQWGNNDNETGNVVNASYTYEFVPMFSLTPAFKATSNTLKNEEGTVSVKYNTYSSFYSFDEEGMESYLEVLESSIAPSNIANLENAYKALLNGGTQQYPQSLAALEAKVESAAEAMAAAQDEVDAYNNQRWALLQAWANAVKAAGGTTGLETAYINAYVEWQDALTNLAAAEQQVNDLTALLATATATEKPLIQASLNMAQENYNQWLAKEKAADAAQYDAYYAWQKSQEGLAAQNQAVANAEKAFKAFTGENPSNTNQSGSNSNAPFDSSNLAVTLYTALGKAKGAYGTALQAYNTRVAQVNAAYTAWQNALNASQGVNDYQKWSAVYAMITGTDIDSLLEALNTASMNNAEGQLDVQEVYAVYQEAYDEYYTYYSYNFSIQEGGGGYTWQDGAYYPSGTTTVMYYTLYINESTGVATKQTVSSVTFTNLSTAIAQTEANISALEVLIENFPGALTAEQALASAEARVESLEAQVKALQTIVDSAKKALDNYTSK